jgi:hypothetical protein
VNLKLEDLIYVNKIADGQFGSVYLVKDNSRNLYTIKVLDKQMLE